MPGSEDLRAAALHELHAWAPTDRGQADLRAIYVAHLDEHVDGVWRECRAGHVTASAIIVDPVHERVLLTLHPLVGRWLQTGGHCEPADVGLPEAALREAREEGGIDDLVVVPGIVRLDRHEVRCRSDLLHHLDVQYLVVAPAGAVHRRSAESLDLAWWPWEALPEPTDESVRLLVRAARARLEGPGPASSDGTPG